MLLCLYLQKYYNNKKNNNKKEKKIRMHKFGHHVVLIFFQVNQKQLTLN